MIERVVVAERGRLRRLLRVPGERRLEVVGEFQLARRDIEVQPYCAAPSSLRVRLDGWGSVSALRTRMSAASDYAE